MNLLHARLSVNGGRPRLDVGSQRLELNGNVLGWRPALRDYDGHDLIVGIRPEDMAEESEANAPRNAVLHSTADLVEAMGSEMLVHFTVDAERVVTEDTQELERDAGTESLGRGRSPHSEVVARFTPRARVREGAPVSAIVDTERLHYFDPATGEAIWGDGARQVA
jgi:multiple sugar transport system ATP-binding protein